LGGKYNSRVSKNSSTVYINLFSIAKVKARFCNILGFILSELPIISLQDEQNISLANVTYNLKYVTHGKKKRPEHNGREY
jgi:hypothetical protein